MRVPEARAYGGSFTTVHFVNPGKFAIGLEPEMILTGGAGVGANLRYTQGLNDLMNATVILGNGAGPRKFRGGGNVTMDFFPDLEGQPGLGLALQGMYFRIDEGSQVDLTLAPYVHKTFMQGGKNEIEPFFTVPFGLSLLSDSTWRATSTLTVGAIFKTTEHFRTVIEAGFGVSNAESYLSGGVAYYH